ncbi:hypothetical protein [Rhizobium sp.]
MTRAQQKVRERLFAERAGGLLGQSWTLGGDRENPDFLVDCEGHIFGLEVVQIFAGRASRKGSAIRQQEAARHEILQRARRRVGELRPGELRVQVVGAVTDEIVDQLADGILEYDIEKMSPGTRFTVTGGGAKAYVTRAFVSDWFAVADRVGWVGRDPVPAIEAALLSKKDKHTAYRAVAEDIRVLIVADRTQNSGKLVLEADTRLDVKPFRAAYFLSYPDSLVVL